MVIIEYQKCEALTYFIIQKGLVLSKYTQNLCQYNIQTTYNGQITKI